MNIITFNYTLNEIGGIIDNKSTLTIITSTSSPSWLTGTVTGHVIANTIFTFTFLLAANTKILIVTCCKNEITDSFSRILVEKDEQLNRRIRKERDMAIRGMS